MKNSHNFVPRIRSFVHKNVYFSIALSKTFEYCNMLVRWHCIQNTLLSCSLVCGVLKLTSYSDNLSGRVSIETETSGNKRSGAVKTCGCIHRSGGRPISLWICLLADTILLVSAMTISIKWSGQDVDFNREARLCISGNTALRKYA